MTLKPTLCAALLLAATPVLAQNTPLTTDGQAGYASPALAAEECDPIETRKYQSCPDTLDRQRAAPDTVDAAIPLVGETLVENLPLLPASALDMVEPAPEGEVYLMSGKTVIRIDSDTRLITKIYYDLL